MPVLPGEEFRLGRWYGGYAATVVAWGIQIWHQSAALFVRIIGVRYAPRSTFEPFYFAFLVQRNLNEDVGCSLYIVILALIFALGIACCHGAMWIDAIDWPGTV